MSEEQSDATVTKGIDQGVLNDEYKTVEDKSATTREEESSQEDMVKEHDIVGENLKNEVDKDTESPSLLTKEQKIDKILELKNTLDSLLTMVRQTKQLCDKYEYENQYLQDYAGSLIKSGDMK